MFDASLVPEEVRETNFSSVVHAALDASLQASDANKTRTRHASPAPHAVRAVRARPHDPPAPNAPNLGERPNARTRPCETRQAWYSFKASVVPRVVPLPQTMGAVNAETNAGIHTMERAPLWPMTFSWGQNPVAESIPDIHHLVRFGVACFPGSETNTTLNHTGTIVL